MRVLINRVVLAVAASAVAVVLLMPSAISSAISSGKAADAMRGRRYIREPIYVTTWRSLSNRQPKVTQLKFGCLVGVIASHVKEPVPSLEVSQKNVLRVMVMAKCVFSKASSQCNKLALSAVALVSTFLSHAKLAMVAASLKNKKLWKSRFPLELMMVCAYALWVMVSQASMVAHLAISM